MEKKNLLRPPIVTILGHVDHGKTTLLDAIRETNIAKKEAGGITQKIGASQVLTKDGKKITFIDTPGHAAFSKMRSRGANVCDIAVLVVAADDGVQPQTKEAILHIKEAKIPFIVAVTKVDLATANIEATLGQLEKEGILLEKRGGDTAWIEISSKTGKGIKELLDLISLISEMNSISGDSKGDLEAVVIETTKDNRGPVANIIVRNGNIKVGDNIYSEFGQCKIRNLLSDKGPVKEALPGQPVQILGFEKLPEVGSKIYSYEFSQKENKRKDSFWAEIKKDQIGVLIKAQNAGSLEAIIGALPQNIVVVSSGVGDIYESDVLEAKSLGVSYIFAFESKISSSVSKLGEAEGITIKNYKIIYELLEELENIIKKGKVEIFGKAEIVASFPFNNKKIAGCKMLQGKISKMDKIVLMRKEQEIGKSKIVSLKKQKQEVNQVGQGEEFGILMDPQLDFDKGDMLVSVAK